MVNIREFSADELRSVNWSNQLNYITRRNRSSCRTCKEEEWQNEDGHILTLISEDDMWNVYAGVNLDGTFQLLSRKLRNTLMKKAFHVIK